ncbi:pirin family protein [Jatrophihabitans lederbergiae]|uniref:Pirin family protein n=1 Tax=Jatrophihabitans lederbergiae TaxID=3075547 RepID=A0ABU2JCF5_9ACTN|nr:pirin family protein [Jatrophihabitans sp. DSM 44399]MDT0262667.1 pirin family protein [Jatrophihabitans sp. DSM 44399]
MSAFDLRPSASRLSTRTEWLDSRHSFAFGQHYEPDNTSFGVLLAHNEDVLAPGAGFDPHPHRDLEIVTWVVEGALAHSDSAGASGVLRSGQVQRMTAGTGVRHSERNDSADRPVRLVQAWVLPDATGLDPSYEQRDVRELLAGGELAPIASGLARHDGADVIRLHQRAAGLHAARLPAGGSVTLPVAPFVHVFVTRGAVTVQVSGAEGRMVLGPGDALRITGADGRQLRADVPAEVLVWEMHAAAL